MKRIGVITFCNCMNYGAELQAFALQKKLNLLGVDAEVIHVQKETSAMNSPRFVLNSILKRYKSNGLYKGTKMTYYLFADTLKSRIAVKKNKERLEHKKQIFDNFWDTYIKHSEQFYTLDEIRTIQNMPYDVIVAGSDQIWNYIQTRYLDVFFLKFANNFGARKVAYAASFSVESIPTDLHQTYTILIGNMDAISVREDSAIDIVKSCSNVDVVQVLDPTLLFKANEWVDMVSNPDYMKDIKKVVLIYTLSGSKYIYRLAKKIGTELNAQVVNIKNGFHKVEGDDGITHLYDVGPREFISLYNRAVYVITDSFHGTAFSLNFNVPFTTLLNPLSSLNGRALSLLRLSNTMNRMIYDDGSNTYPKTLKMDFAPVNEKIEHWRKLSMEYIETQILK